MHSGMAAGAQFGEETGIRVCREHHVAGTICYDIAWICGNVVEQLHD